MKSVTAEILCIGDELLIGQVINSNAAWMGKELGLIGIKVSRHTAIGDEKAEIVAALDEAISRADIVLITGGLGPTKDDITKHTLAEYFNSKLVFNEQAFDNMVRLFSVRGRQVPESSKNQAVLPEDCMPIYNELGTAPGMWFERNGKVIISMPGVPHEMQGMMTSNVIPELKKRFNTPRIIHKTIWTHGAGESTIAEMIADWEDSLPSYMKLAYLPATGLVRLRLSAMGEQENLEKEVEEKVEQVKPLLAEYIFGYDEDKLEEIIGRLLIQQGKTLAIAESCSGGYVSHLVTSVPGSSAYYRGSVIPYSNDLKQSILHITPSHFTTVGAVSEEVAREMVMHVKELFKSDYAISTTGIAGPAGATPQKQVGTVWIGIATPDGVITRKVLLGSNRLRIIEVTGITALNMLRKELLKRA